MFRFPSCFKLRAPFNALCLLDPRNVDIFFETDDEMHAAVTTIKEDRVYTQMREQLEVEGRAVGDDQNDVFISAEATDGGDEPGSRRDTLLARKKAQVVTSGGLVENVIETFEQKVDREITR